MKRYKVMAALAILLALFLTTASSFAAPLSQTQTVEFKEISGAPLRIQVGSNGSVQVFHQKHPETGAAYGTADSGFFLAIGSDVYSPDLANSGGTTAYPSGAANRLTLVSHEGPTGAGTVEDPFKIVTNQTLNGSGANLGVVQTVSYINGNEYFRQDWNITNNGSAEVCFKAYHAADVYFAGSDSGAGYYNPASGSVGGYNEAQDWFMVFTPVTPADHYQEGHYTDNIWNTVKSAGDLTDTIVSESVDNGFALQWNKCIQPGETTTITDLWSFGENAESVIPPTPEPEPPTPVPPVVTPPTTSSRGDVHIRTPDGLVYDFQAVGDYILSQTTTGEVKLQARQETPANNPQVSVNTAAGLYVAGDKLEFYLRPERSFYINDVLTDLPTGFVQLPQGGSIDLSGTGSPTDYTIIWPDGNTGARVIVYADHLDLGIARLGGSLTYEGVLGNLDWDTQNDMQIRGGELITPPATADQLKTFGDSWLVPAGESLFDDVLPTDEAAVAEAPLTLLDIDPAVRAEAKQTCQNADISNPLALDNCTYDVGATGDVAFVESAKAFQESFEQLPPEEQTIVPAVPSQALEIGAQYAVPDVPGTFRYFQLTQLPDQAGGQATLSLCPDMQESGLVNIADVMTAEAALGQGLTASNEPCAGAAIEVAEAAATEAAPAEEPAAETATEAAPAEEPAAETATEAAPAASTPAPAGGNGICGAPLAMPLLVGLVFLTANRRRRR